MQCISSYPCNKIFLAVATHEDLRNPKNLSFLEEGSQETINIFASDGLCTTSYSPKLACSLCKNS
ncbi:Imm47 family immunity protein [Fictibacillus fluitans]|uniref:Imm47 family immunity protein n=1 Tax=Fictibacillus fluitans TaxID=3058422 RepID=A0ABT8HT86_9BACL|nr:Imm47 family immunity protein [Fictibacillus sp. NE201]MDN4523976.1 Imm47 family immunity protein [Fictibacillus sp. NE201]